ncbi:MAG: hypothetical protein IT168_16310 [Bryobacterales bacterium]|nr:hypothetical protein [Bryobacterales bacterium]
MPDEAAGTTPLNMAAEFPPITTAEWEAAIRADLAGADYEKKLVWRTDEGINVRPYYRAADVQPLDIDPGQPPFVRGSPKPWEMMAPTAVPADAVRADWFHESGANAVEELAWALAWGVEKVANGAVSGDMDFVFAIGSNYFFEIAKLRAARLLWANAVAAFDPAMSAQARIRAVTALSNKSIYDPYTNLLRATTEALSAAIGGADTIAVRPVQFDQHLADNIHRILREESHIGDVTDPGGGCYLIEAMTSQLAEAAWKLFQQVEAAGGYTKALPAIERTLAAGREAKLKSISSRRRTLVGVNNYPDLTEKELDNFSLAAADTGPFPALRLASEFEEIRLRTERHARASGHTPVVLLLERGELKWRMARSNFCTNFFGCGGFKIVASAELQPADLVVLCSSDAEYPALAKEVVPATTAPVIVAGNPKEQIEELKQAGVKGFVHVLSNAVETLRHWQDELRLEK